MKHEHWIIESANLLVERYTGVVNKNDIGKGEGRLYRMLDETRPILSIVDVSQAIFFNIKHDEIKQVFQGFEGRIGNNAKGKFVIYNGNNAKDDYLKTSLFSKYETEDVRIQNFIDLKEASDWLELAPEETAKVFRYLSH